MKFNSRIQDNMACILFLVFVPALAHLLFSWMGFVPSIEGLNLAFSRRILEGQVPHRDFINIRPIGSGLLYTPLILFGGGYTYWISRFFVWFEYACIAWIWTAVTLRSIKSPLSLLEKFILAVISFILTTHFFPVFSWYTTDSLFFLSLGLGLCFEGTPRNKFLGYILMGMAYLCKQTFLPTVFLFLFIMQDWRKLRFSLAASVPGIMYCVYLLFNGAVADAVLQLCARSNDFFPRGIRVYLHVLSVPWGIILGYFSMMLSFGQIKLAGLGRRIRLQQSIGILLLFSTPFGFSIGISRSIHAAWTFSYALFATTLGALIYLIIGDKPSSTSLAKIGLLVLITAWSASLSTGYNTPALMAGPLAILLIVFAYAPYHSGDKNNTIKIIFHYLLITLFAVSLFTFGISRNKFVFKDRPAPELIYSLADVFPGGRLIKIGPNTYHFLLDLKEALDKTKGQDFAVIPGLPAYWAKSEQKNPLIIDLAIKPEISTNQSLVNRVKEDLDAHRGKIVLLLAKIEPDCLSHGFSPLADKGEIPRYVRSHFTKVSETKYFELYQ